MAATRLHYILLAAAAILLLLGLAHQHAQVGDTLKQAWGNQSPKQDLPSLASTSVPASGVPAGHASPASSSSQSSQHRASFHEIALKHGTDKVTDHQYWFMYDKHFPAIRDQKIKMLEIGLGCDMSYGPGKSYYTWLEYFPNVELYYMEYDANCAAKWASKTTGATIYTGDQADPVFLQKFIDETGGEFDVIIDDGGHTMNQQKVSLEMLWKIVKPGGMYFIEDLQTSFMGGYGGDATGGKDAAVFTMSKYIYELIDDKLTPDGTRHPMSLEMRSIECQREQYHNQKKKKPYIRLLILSDTHNDAFPDPSSLPTDDIDVVLHCGDLTNTGGRARYQRALDSLARIRGPALKLVIAGNHDRSLDADWWDVNMDRWDDPDEPAACAALMRSRQSPGDGGVHFLDEGTHEFTLPGEGRPSFRLYASPYTPEYRGWAFAYPPGTDRFNGDDGRASRSRIPDGVDIVMTHGPPRLPAAGSSSSSSTNYTLDVNGDGTCCGCRHLFRAIERVKPLLHCFGHIHEGHGSQTVVWEGGAEGILSVQDAVGEVDDTVVRCTVPVVAGAEKKETLLVNAAIKSQGPVRDNLPWIVTLDLPDRTR